MNSKKFIITLLTAAAIGGFTLIPAGQSMALQFPSVNPPSQTEQTQVSQPVKQQSSSNSDVRLPRDSEGKIVLGKFFTTMLWVVGSCAVLFVILLIYKKRTAGMSMSVQRPMTKEQDLTSPSTVDEAVRLFIEKF